MLFQCQRVEANFPAENMRLVHQDQARLLWDEHGGTFVLRVEHLAAEEAPDAADQAGIRMEVALPEAPALAHRIEGFAGRHSLSLAPQPAAEVIAEPSILVACHVPGKQLFIYCENPELSFRRTGPQTMEVRVGGAFKARRLPCRETDLVIHLELGPMARVLGGLLAWTREG